MARGTHNKSRSPTYYIWCAMKSRCNNSKNAKFHLYGGKGISYDPRWERFENFLTEMGERPLGRTLERVNGNEGYCKANCTWATPKEQANNTSRNISVFLLGKSQTIAQWAQELKIPYSTLMNRYRRTGPSEASMLRAEKS